MNIRIGNIIKTGILGAAMAVLATACSKGDDGPKGRAISFDCTAESMADIWNSRAAKTDESNIASFRVWGTWRNDDQTFIQPFMTSQIVEKFETSWVYAPTMYAPTEGSVDFVAYSPAISAGVLSFDSGSSSYQPSIKYAVPTDLTLQEDFMVATTLRNTSSTVDLDFKHMLAAFNFVAYSDLAGTSYRIHQITINNVPTTGTLSGNTSGATATWSWGSQSGKDNYVVYPPSNALVVSGGGDQSLNPTTGSVMVLPHTATLTGSDRVYLSVRYDAISGTIIKENNTLNLDLSSLGTTFAFQEGKNYTFRIKFNSSASRSLSASELSPAVTLEVHVSEQ
ncbi:fimbrillin family protein [Alistipes sp. OttesenSCG-928-L06]|nr:fimbrillin family protein [Alistipes sp. OttesenSCG-928-L06]